MHLPFLPRIFLLARLATLAEDPDRIHRLWHLLAKFVSFFGLPYNTRDEKKGFSIHEKNIKGLLVKQMEKKALIAALPSIAPPCGVLPHTPQSSLLGALHLIPSW
jgi:hypothetical protein